MLSSLSLFIVAVAVDSLALPSDIHVLHERHDATTRTQWQRGDRVAGDAIIPLRIGLTQQNLHTGHDLLMDVSSSTSKKYGEHLTAEEVREIFQPTADAVREVKAWLTHSGVDDKEIVHSDNKGWLAADIPASDFERLFKAELYEHNHWQNGKTRIGCPEYHIPKRIRHHIDYITPGVKLSAPVNKKEIKRSAPDGGWGWHGRKWGPRPSPPGWTPPYYPHGPWHPPPGSGQLPPDLQDCGRNVTPACVRALYDIPRPTHIDPANTVGLFESGDHYSPADINLFLAKYAPYVPQGTFPKAAYIDGADGPVAQDSPLNTGESDIDIDMITSLVYPQTITLYQTDDIPQATEEGTGQLEGFLNTFLDALDGSYCTYSAYGITGNSPGIDAQYPDPQPGGYKGKLQCGMYKPARVISGSYGEAENDLPLNYQLRQCNEFMKLALQGHTILFSSGDYGVASNAGDNSPTGCLSGNGQNQTIYSPGYPVNCPYITAVGATQLSANQTVRDPESALQVNLGPGAELFASAGGFANFFPTPSYQKRAVAKYFARHDPGHPYYTADSQATNIGQNGGIYNRGGRGIPDISANGAFYPAYNGGVRYHFFGTSLAAPLWASVITLINEQRSAVGKAPVGFINPVLYENPWALIDITNGSNPGCGSSGFKAIQGWDPITGLGTPNYPDLLKMFLSLP